MSAPFRSSRRVALVLAIVTLLAIPAGVFAQGGGQEVIAGGLNNPRGLAFGPEGALYVAEAGTGSGDTGAITRIDLKKGSPVRFVTGLPSRTADEGDAVGPTDIAFHGRGNAYVTIGLGADPADRAVIGPDFGWLAKIPASGKPQLRADVAQHEADENPAGGPVDSNPYSVAALPGGYAVVADAGANALLHVNVGTGAVSTLAVFPSRVVPVDAFTQGVFGLPPAMPAESVPNSVVVGPDGAYYVGELLGFPFTPGQSRVYRVAPNGSYSVYAEGFTAIIDLAFDAQGNLHVLEIAKNGLVRGFVLGDWTGALIKVDAVTGVRTEVASAGLSAPGGVTFGPGGAIYVTNNSTSVGTGQVLKIQQ